jgi:hypothetical protein
MSASFLGALCLFSSVCVVCAISAFTLPIETKGRALQVSDSGSAWIFFRHLKTIFNYVYAYVSACGYVNQCKCPGAGVTGIYEVPNMGAS